MAIRESLLDALSSIATSDFVRSVTSAGASSKVTVSNLAKSIIENYTGSTLAGSAQSVKSAIDTIASTYQEKLVSGTNIKTINSQSILSSGDVSAQEAFPSMTVPTIVNPSMFSNLLGGYSKGGSVVIVQVGIYVSGTFAANDYFTALSGLPVPNTAVALAVSTNSTTSKGATALLQTDGQMRIDSGPNALTAETLYICGVYMTA